MIGRSLLVVAASVCLSACGRMSVTFSLGPSDGQLHESVVLDETSGHSAAKVAMIDVRGLIMDAPTPGLLQGGPSPVDEFVARLDRAERDPDVRAVILRVNSPGGSVSASDTMYRELRRFRETSGKPVVASLAEVAASGGYYLALGADEIVAQPTSITGSIGVIMPTINVSEGLGRIGIVSRSVKSGPNKDMGNPLEPMRESQYALLQSMVDEFYGRFRSLVVERRCSPSVAPPAERRGLDPARLDELADGRAVTGAEAVRSGLADREGGLREALERAKALAGLERARLIKYHPDGDVLRSPYAPTAQAESGPPSPTTEEINLLRVDLGGGASFLSGGNAYYLWTMGGV